MATVDSESQAVHRQLERALASSNFARSERLSRFLRFVVERHLEGHDGDLKESVIGMEVFGNPDYDPRQDSTVRTEAGRLRARVELRQIGPRDEARLQGGIGPCGRDLCCATFLKDFEPVSVRMAKDQDLPVNPLRIAGACGRLMCCLKYEHPLYQKFRQEAPRIGSTVESPEGPGTVVGHNVPGDKVVVKLAEDGRRCACPKASVCGSRQAYEAKYGSGQ